MLYREIFRIFSYYLWGLIIPLAVPLCIAIYCEWIHPEKYPQPPSGLAFFFTILICFILGLLCFWLGRNSSKRLYRRESLVLVLAVYFLTPLLGGLPFYFNKTLTNPLDAYFEMTSGLTTTGSTILEAKNYDPLSEVEVPIEKSFLAGKKVTYSYYGTVTPVRDPRTQQITLSGLEALSPALIFWRSLTQWLGGGGIIVLFVAILPALGVGGKILYQTEVTGPTKESMAPRVKETASQLWKLYLGLTLLQTFLLVVTNKRISVFDAVMISFSTISTGGFIPNNTGIFGYESAFTDWIIIIFMLLGSISFSLYFFCMRGRIIRLNDPELKCFLCIVILSSLFATWQLMGKPHHFLNEAGNEVATYSFFEALRYGTFQVVSAQTTTGFATANYDIWPFSIQVLMIILMYAGGMAGSTAGGLKVIRLQTSFRILLNKIETIFRPDTVRNYRVGDTIIHAHSALTILCFVIAAISIAIIGTFLLVLDGIDPETSMTTISSLINNSGLAFRKAGPTDSYAFLSNFGKIIGSIWMIAGRLEFFALLIAFVPDFWRTK